MYPHTAQQQQQQQQKSDCPASASQVAQTTGVFHHVWVVSLQN
jgi:hypothetical protein